jgi:cytochrome P450
MLPPPPCATLIGAMPDPLDVSAGVPYGTLARLRRECPVSRTQSGAYFLARYADVTGAVRDVDTFQASFREPGVVVPPEEQLVSEIPEPRHGRIRRIINSAIAQHRIGRVEPFVRQLCHDLLDALLGTGHVELVHDYVMPIPTTVIAYLLGSDPADYQLWAGWSDEVVQGTYPTLNRNARGEGLAGAHPEFAAYIDGLIAARRAAADPPDDFITRLITTEVDGQRLTDVEMRSQLAFLLISGNETTRHLIANLLSRVCADPALFDRLAAAPGLIPAAVEESLRMDPPIHVLMRNCTADTAIGGVTVPAGCKVAFGLASANRDEHNYVDGDVFRLDRDNGRDHLAFGGGPHVCPGASLARLEGRVALEVFCERVAAADLDAGYVREQVPVFWANGPRRLPVTLTPR